jgi:hypothetical protein
VKNYIEGIDRSFMVVLLHVTTSKDVDLATIRAIDHIETLIDRLKSPDERLKLGREIMREDYEGDIGVIADGVEAEAKRMVEKDERDRGALERFLTESVDGSSRVLNSLEAQEGLASSSHSDAYFDESEEPLDEPNWMALMYAALHADVIEELEGRGIEMDRPFDGFAVEDDDEEVEVEVEAEDAEPGRTSP